MINQGLLEEPAPQGQPAPAMPQGQPAAPMQGQPAPQGQPAAPQVGATQRDYNRNPLGEVDKENYEKFVISATKLIHSPQTRDTILKRIGISDQGPIEDISSTVLLLVDRIDQQAIKDEGAPVDDAIKIQGANEVTGQIIQVAEAAGKIPKLTDDEKAVAYSYAVQKYTDRLIANGDITREELQGYADQALQTANANGDLDMNKVSQAAQEGGPAPTPAPAAAAAPEQPAETMSQKLAKEGLLDG